MIELNIGTLLNNLAYVCKTLPETELPFQVSVEEAQEYAREEHDVFSAFENWRL